ncbi:MAG: SDR family oxidoreductase [Rhodospirillales bacterium]|nr:MAG: SDR family oxidoreductase [Rhodospirillales bacterium]
MPALDITRVCLVTGASSGIGAATARALAGPGIGVAVHARRNLEGAARVAAAVESAGGVALVVEGDLAEPSTASRLIEAVTARFGRLDVLVSNAGFADRRPIGELDRPGYDASMAAMQNAFFDLLLAARPWLEKAVDGRVVAVSSFVAHAMGRGLPVFPATAAAKAGIEAMAKAFAVQMAPHGVTVNCVAPGFVEKDPGAHTALTPGRKAELERAVPAGRFARQDEIAAAIAFLCAPSAAYITGQVLGVDGGVTL